LLNSFFGFSSIPNSSVTSSTRTRDISIDFYSFLPLWTLTNPLEFWERRNPFLFKKQWTSFHRQFLWFPCGCFTVRFSTKMNVVLWTWYAMHTKPLLAKSIPSASLETLRWPAVAFNFSLVVPFCHFCCRQAASTSKFGNLNNPEAVKYWHSNSLQCQQHSSFHLLSTEYNHSSFCLM
jgi:hypothetical protein